MKKIIFLFSILIFIASFSLTLLIKGKTKIEEKTNLPSPSENILFLTAPVNSLSGQVKAVYPNRIIVSQNFVYQQAPPMAEIVPLPNQSTPTPFPTPITKIITFEVLIDKETRFQRQNFTSPFILTPQPTPNLSTADIKEGMILNITTKEDLRTTKNNQVTALTIVLPPITNELSGKIARIEENKLELELDFAYLPPSPEEENKEGSQKKSITVRVNEKTEISYFKLEKEMVKMGEDAPPVPMETQKPIKLSLSDLKVGDQVKIYSFEDLLKTSLPLVVRIEPLNQK